MFCNDERLSNVVKSKRREIKSSHHVFVYLSMFTEKRHDPVIKITSLPFPCNDVHIQRRHISLTLGGDAGSTIERSPSGNEIQINLTAITLIVDKRLTRVFDVMRVICQKYTDLRSAGHGIQNGGILTTSNEVGPKTMVHIGP